MRSALETNNRGACPLLTLMWSQLCDLYENDCIFDKFDCAFSGDGSHLATGTYSNCFRALSIEGMEENEAGADVTLEASRDPQRKRLHTHAKVTASDWPAADRHLHVSWNCFTPFLRHWTFADSRSSHELCTDGGTGRSGRVAASPVQEFLQDHTAVLSCDKSPRAYKLWPLQIQRLSMLCLVAILETPLW